MGENIYLAGIWLLRRMKSCESRTWEMRGKGLGPTGLDLSSGWRA